MKKLLFLLIAFVAVNTISAQRLSESKVPAAAKAAFKKQYPNIKSVTWEMENGNYEANFRENGKSMGASYDKNGNLQESEVDIKTSELPANAVSYVKSHYKMPIKEASKKTKTNGEVEYEAMVGRTDVMFDANGNYLRQMKGENEAMERKEGMGKKGKKQ